MEPIIVHSFKHNRLGVLSGGVLYYTIHFLDGTTDTIKEGEYRVSRATTKRKFFTNVRQKMEKEQPSTFECLTDSSYFELQDWFDGHFGIEQDDDGDCSGLAREFANFVWDSIHPKTTVESMCRKTLSNGHVVKLKISDNSAYEVSASIAKVKDGFKLVMRDICGCEVCTYNVKMFAGFDFSKHVVFTNCVGDMVYAVVVPKEILETN